MSLHQLRPRKQKSVCKSINYRLGGRLKRKKLVTFVSKTDNDSNGQETDELPDIDSIYEAMPEKDKNNEWAMTVSLKDKKKYGNKQYLSPLSSLLDVGDDGYRCYLLLNYINNIHRKNPEFSAWFTSKCTLPGPEISMLQIGNVLYLDSKYVHILHAFEREECYMWSGYDTICIGSGREVDISFNGIKYISNDNRDIVYIDMDENYVSFTDIHEARCDYIEREARDQWIGFLYAAIDEKIKIRGDPRRVRFSSKCRFKFIWDNYLHQKLVDNDVVYLDRKSYTKFEVSKDEISEIFKNETIGDKSIVFERETGKYKYYIDQISFIVSKNKRPFYDTLKINGVFLKYNKSLKTTDGLHLLKKERKKKSDDGETEESDDWLYEEEKEEEQKNE